MAAKKVVLQLSIHEKRIWRKAFVTVSRFTGITSITMDEKTGTLTVVGEVDVPAIVMKLRKICKAEIVSVDDVKSTEKKPEPEKPKPGEFIPYSVLMNCPYPCCAYADPYYQSNPCVIL